MLHLAPKVRAVLLVAFALFLAIAPARAAFIVFRGETTEDTGTGFGNVINTLILQQPPNTGLESGSVLWDGSDDVLSGDAMPASQTQTVAAVKAKGFDKDNLIVILNLNQRGSWDGLDVHEFALRFYTSPDGSSWFDAPFDEADPRNTAGTHGLTPHGQGTGSAGYVFRIFFDETQGEGEAFFADDRNRVGAIVPDSAPIDNVPNDGPENFYLGDADVNEVVPEPSSLALIVLGLGAIASRRTRRSRSDAPRG